MEGYMTIKQAAEKWDVVKATDFCPITDGIACP